MKRTTKEKKSADKYLDKRHKFYADAVLVDAVDRLAALNKTERRKYSTRSQLLENAAKALIRANATRLRKAGVTLPADLFTK